jgi:hypothetical protein
MPVYCYYPEIRRQTMDINGSWSKLQDFCRWVYENITLVVGVILFIDTIVFFSGKSGFLTAILNLIVLGVFALRMWNEYRSTEET